MKLTNLDFTNSRSPNFLTVKYRMTTEMEKLEGLIVQTEFLCNSYAFTGFSPSVAGLYLIVQTTEMQLAFSWTWCFFHFSFLLYLFVCHFRSSTFLCLDMHHMMCIHITRQFNLSPSFYSNMILFACYHYYFKWKNQFALFLTRFALFISEAKENKVHSKKISKYIIMRTF